MTHYKHVQWKYGPCEDSASFSFKILHFLHELFSGLYWKSTMITIYNDLQTSSWHLWWTAKLMRHFHNINGPSDVAVSMVQRPSRRDVSWDISRRLQLTCLIRQTVGGCSREKDHKREMPLHLCWTDRLIPLLDLSERDGSDAQAWSEDKQAVFHEGFGS